MHKIRKLRKKDREHIIELFNQLVSKPEKFNYFKDLNIDLMIRDRNCHCVVVEHNKKVIGFGSIIVFLTPVHGHKGRIEDIIIHKDHRGQGLGKKLVEELISIAKNKNIRNIHLTSNPSREAARNLYKTLGFEQYDTGVFVLDI